MTDDIYVEYNPIECSYEDVYAHIESVAKGIGATIKYVESSGRVIDNAELFYIRVKIRHER